ncbi:hypothetical protein SAMN04515695_4457 [Pseudovibrio sp. Tun.PSC04-5.I4]|nr:hypothetical protein SAMN04515695_4457 [Pseudovibrio sp. Tun.PSC04-5.I4]
MGGPINEAVLHSTDPGQAVPGLRTSREEDIPATRTRT